MFCQRAEVRYNSIRKQFKVSNVFETNKYFEQNLSILQLCSTDFDWQKIQTYDLFIPAHIVNQVYNSDNPFDSQESNTSRIEVTHTVAYKPKRMFNGWRYVFVADFEALSYQVTTTFDTG